MGVRDYQLWSGGDDKESQTSRDSWLGSQWAGIGNTYFEDQGHKLIKCILLDTDERLGIHRR